MLLDLSEHAVEGLDQLPHFVLGLFDGADGVIALLGIIRATLGQVEDGLEISAAVAHARSRAMAAEPPA